MGNVVTRSAKRMLRTVGVDISRVPPWRQYDWLKACDVRTVLDVGANTGQFAVQIGDRLPDATIYSFEPLADCYQKLVERMRNRPRFQAFNFALGDRNGSATMHHNEFSPSSSLLPMEDLQWQAFSYTQNTRQEEIEIRRLDDLACELQLLENILVKIDVQGAEDMVIRGGTAVLSRASILVVETSFMPLYQGQMLFDGIYDLLRPMGFAFMGCEESIRNPMNGVALQADSIFIRRGGDDDAGFR